MGAFGDYLEITWEPWEPLTMYLSLSIALNRQLSLECHFHQIHDQLKNVSSCYYFMKSKFFSLSSKVPYLPVLFLPVSQHALCPSRAISSCHPIYFLRLIPRPVPLLFLLPAGLPCLSSLLRKSESFFQVPLSSCHFPLLWTTLILPFS